VGESGGPDASANNFPRHYHLLVAQNIQLQDTAEAARACYRERLFLPIILQYTNLVQSRSKTQEVRPP
jgi:hypothetical protein